MVDDKIDDSRMISVKLRISRQSDVRIERLVSPRPRVQSHRDVQNLM